MINNKMEPLALLVPCSWLNHSSQNSSTGSYICIPCSCSSDSPRETHSSGVRQSNSVLSNTSRGRKDGNVGEDCCRPFLFLPMLISWREVASVTGMRELVDTPISSSRPTRLWEEYCRLRLEVRWLNGYILVTKWSCTVYTVGISRTLSVKWHPRQPLFMVIIHVHAWVCKTYMYICYIHVHVHVAVLVVLCIFCLIPCIAQFHVHVPLTSYCF